MAARRVYKALELGLNKGAAEPEADQSFRVARKTAVANSLTMSDVVKDSGEAPPAAPHQPEKSGAHYSGYEWQYPEAAAPKPKAKRAPPKKKSPAPTKKSKFPKELPYQCRYKRSIYTKKTAKEDAYKRLQTDTLEEHTFDKTMWVFAKPIEDAYKQEAYGVYSGTAEKLVGSDKDITLVYMYKA